MYMGVNQTWKKNMRRVVGIIRARREIRGMKYRVENRGDFAGGLRYDYGSRGESAFEDRTRRRQDDNGISYSACDMIDFVRWRWCW